MRKIDSFIGEYPVTKTLRFSLQPVGKTLDNFEALQLLADDEMLAEEYKRMKLIIDRYHKYYMESVLSKIRIDASEYAELYYKHNKNESEMKRQNMIEESLRKQISKALKSDGIYSKLKPGSMIKELLPEFVEKGEEANIVEHFRNFTTYFEGFFSNRQNMYSEEEKSTSIAYRIVNDNLPKFLDNVRSFEKIILTLPQEYVDCLHTDFDGIVNFNDMFTIDYFSFVTAQSGIDKYNNCIGGFTLSDGEKVKGINEYINLYNQGVDKAERLPKLKMLYKQILSDRETFSFVAEEFEDDNSVLQAINSFYTTNGAEAYCIQELLEKLAVLFDDLHSFNSDEIYIANGRAITDISNEASGYWGTFRDKWNLEYEARNPIGKKANIEKYEEKRSKAYKAIKSFSLKEVGEYLEFDIIEYYKEKVFKIINDISSCYEDSKALISNEYKAEKRLSANDNAVALIKNLLDSIKLLERFVKPLLGTGKEEKKDETFYGEFTSLYDSLSLVDRLYDMVRNYITQKPYSNDKIKLNFKNSQLLDGWDRNKETANCSVLLQRGNDYYLAIMDKRHNRVFESIPEGLGDNPYMKIEYKLLPGPNKMLPKVFFSKSRIDEFAPSEEILRIREQETFKKGENFNIEDCHKLIEFFKASIEKHPEWREFGFSFSPTQDYADISQFYKEVQEQGYKISKTEVSESYINSLVDEGKIYLFRIYNKDFSEHSKGTPNLHTLYFKMLFDERNLENVVYKLNGKAEMFYRKASIKKSDIIVHPANQPIENKNPNKNKEFSVFEYDLIKDKRYTKPQFSLHLPITMNFRADGTEYINDKVRYALKNSDSNYVIGIDRGERNLIYVCVINSEGEIVEQHSFNTIKSEYNGKSHEVDYHELLDIKEKKRLEARQNWGTIENIKELKEGYISQVVHKICELVVKYDAIIAMEDLNSGFKNSRVRVEKQVYQKFEKMLIDKLNYLVDKKADPTANGGLLKAYQLTNEFKSFKKMGVQNGFIFYIPPWLTSKIDPTTGFVNLMNPRFTNISSAKALISSFDRVVYNSVEDLFEITFDYKNIPRGSVDYKGSWTICTNSTRILTFRNPEKNNKFDNVELVLTDEFKRFFDKHGIDYLSSDIKAELLNGNNRDFYKEFIDLLRLTLQMRNSITGRTDVDYLISPVRNSTGAFYDSRIATEKLPKDADANGAYNIARKALWAVEQIKQSDDEAKAKISISNAEWLEYAQK